MTKFYILNILALQGPLVYCLRLNFEQTYDLMIIDMVIYVTLINLTEMEYILLLLLLLLLLLKSYLFRCLCVLESLTLDKSKLYCVEMETSNNCFIANVNAYRYKNLIKTDNYFRTNCCLVVNFKQNRFEIK